MEGLIAGIPVLGVIGIVAGAIVAIGIVVGAVRKVWRFFRRIGEFLDDWGGESARPGVEARPGVMVRLDRLEDRVSYVEGQMRPNGGSSVYDKVTRIDGSTG